MCVCVCACVRVFMCVLCVYVYVYVCMYVCMYVYIHICIGLLQLMGSRRLQVFKFFTRKTSVFLKQNKKIKIKSAKT
jgi:hypothetical protein